MALSCLFAMDFFWWSLAFHYAAFSFERQFNME